VAPVGLVEPGGERDGREKRVQRWKTERKEIGRALFMEQIKMSSQVSWVSNLAAYGRKGKKRNGG